MVSCPLVTMAVLAQEVTAILLSSLLIRVIWAVHRLANPLLFKVIDYLPWNGADSQTSQSEWVTSSRWWQ